MLMARGEVCRREMKDSRNYMQLIRSTRSFESLRIAPLEFFARALRIFVY